MKQVDYNDALKHFQSHELYWEAFVGGFRLMREDVIAKMKRNMETPTVTDRAYADAQLVAKLSAIDDVIYELELPPEQDAVQDGDE